MDDDFDDLPVASFSATTAAAAKRPIVLDDSDDDLPPPPPAKPSTAVVNLDDDDDFDIPPPPALKSPATAAAAPPPPSALKQSTATTASHADPSASSAAAASTSSSSKSAADNNNNSSATAADSALPTTRPRSVVIAAPDPPVATPTAAAEGGKRVSIDATATAAAGSPRATTRARSGTIGRSKLYKEGYLSKLQPTWPYTPQKRWCVVQNRVLAYYESKENLSKSSGTLDLRQANFVAKPNDKPFSFGISMQGDSSQAAGHGASSSSSIASKSNKDNKAGGGRMYVFLAQNEAEYKEWELFLSAVVSARASTELHWFDKMSQGIF